MVNTQTTGILMQGGEWLEYDANSYTVAANGKFYNEFAGGLSAEFIDYMTMGIQSNMSSVTIQTVSTDNWLYVYNSVPGAFDPANYTITGNNNFTAYFKAGSHSNTNNRIATIKITGVNFYTEITITQIGTAARLSFKYDILSLPYNPTDRIPLVIESNVTWSLTRYSGDWFYFYESKTGGSQLTSLSGEGSRTIYVSASVYSNSTDLRSGTIRVYNSGNALNDYATLYQSPEHFLIIKPSAREYDHNSGTYSVDIHSSVPSDNITITDQTLGLVTTTLPSSITTNSIGEYTLPFSIGANSNTSQGKLGNIFFENSRFKVSTNNHRLHRITQTPKPITYYLTISDSDVAVTSHEQSVEVFVSTNSPSVSVTSDKAWLSATLVNDILTIIVTENTSTDSFRDGTITLKTGASYGNITKTVKVFQMYRYIGGGGAGEGADVDFDFGNCDCSVYQGGTIEYYNCIETCFQNYLYFQIRSGSL